MILFHFQYRLTPQTRQKIKDLKEKGAPPYKKLLPICVLILIVAGIYFGILTPTESAAFSFLFVLCFSFYRLKGKVVLQVLKESLAKTTIIFMVAIGAKLLTVFLTLTGMVAWLQELVFELQPHSWIVLFFVVILYLLLGMFLDPIGILVFTLPFVLPLADFLDGIYFG